MPGYNGISMMATEEWYEPDAIFVSDACLVGCGTWYKEKGFYFHSQFPEFIQQMESSHKCLGNADDNSSHKCFGMTLERKENHSEL